MHYIDKSHMNSTQGCNIGLWLNVNQEMSLVLQQGREEAKLGRGRGGSDLCGGWNPVVASTGIPYTPLRAGQPYTGLLQTLLGLSFGVKGKKAN